MDPPKKDEEKVSREQQEASFNMLKGWAKESGVLGMENIDFPTFFTDDFSDADKKF